MSYKVYRDMLGGRWVKYQCPNCRAVLESRLQEAGGKDTCPDCKTTFIVPGSKERLEIEAEDLQRATKKEQERKVRQEAQKERQREQTRIARLAAQQQAKVERGKEQQRHVEEEPASAREEELEKRIEELEQQLGKQPAASSMSCMGCIGVLAVVAVVLFILTLMRSGGGSSAVSGLETVENSAWDGSVYQVKKWLQKMPKTLIHWNSLSGRPFRKRQAATWFERNIEPRTRLVAMS